MKKQKWEKFVDIYKSKPIILFLTNPILFFKVWDNLRLKAGKRRKDSPYDRAGIISIEKARRLFNKFNGKPPKICGMRVPMNSKRYRCYFKKGTNCVKCGKKGLYFAVERNKTAPKIAYYHLNLYAVSNVGNEKMITIDHIIPKSKGGIRNQLSNHQPMCEHCNREKADYLPGEPRRISKRALKKLERREKAKEKT